MAPNGESFVAPFSMNNLEESNKTRRLSMEGIYRAMSDLSFELSKEPIDVNLASIFEVEDAKCECCGMSEECTHEYVHRVKEKFLGKWICGLCSEAVKEGEKNGGRREEALDAHMSVCLRFNRIERTQPVLLQAEAMREILRKSSSKNLEGGGRCKSNSPRERGSVKKGGITRSISCIPNITKD